jgi:glycine betaine/proline transport system permease protein
MTAISLRAAPRIDPRAARPIALAALGLAAVVLYLVFRDTAVFPHDDDAGIFKSINGVRDWIDDNRNTNPVMVVVVGTIRVSIGWIASTILDGLHFIGWVGIIGVAGALGALAGGWRIAVLMVGGLLALGFLGLWTESIDTLGLTLAAVLVSLAIGVPLGIVVARSRRFQAVIGPVLDVMQIMPTFSYLAPMALLFGIGVAPTTIATLIYAMPAAIRITALGIRRVPSATVEAAESLGATGWQVLRKVQLPLARRVIGLAINQTIMLALGMVVITVLINAPGLGVPIIRALERNNVGAAFDAGIAIVILAILLDRLTEHASERMDARAGVNRDSTDPAVRRRRRRLVIGALAVAAMAVAVSLQIPEQFPTDVSISLRDPINAVTDWIKANLFVVTGGIKNVFTEGFLNPLEGILVSAPWWLVVVVVFGVGLLISGRRAAITAAVCLLLVAGLQLWQHGMQTLASVLVATATTLLLGLALGIMSARSDRFAALLRPLLDVAQTMPSFVYLLPAVALFDPTRFTAILAAVIYAVPPVIRLVDAGIRAVPETIIEAATASGATEGQLLRKVRLPVSAPALLLAVNQGIVMVLAMVVVGGLVGAGGLGYDVVAGFAQREDFGKGLAAGISIVLLGIMLDRITQGAGTRRPRIARAAG